MFADVSKEALPKRRIWVNIESLVFAVYVTMYVTAFKICLGTYSAIAEAFYTGNVKSMYFL